MSRHVLLIFIAAVAVLLMFGCSDDDCPNCPSNVDTITVDLQYVKVTGSITLNSNRLSFYGSVQGLDGSLPDVDSVTVQGSPADLEMEIGPSDSYWRLSYGTDPEGFESGDTVEVIVYTPRGNGTCRVELLHLRSDTVQIVSHSTTSPYDTVDIDTDIEIVWNSVPGADWYSCELWLYFIDAGYVEFDWVSNRGTQDTTMVISAADNGIEGEWWIDVMAVTGPYPEDEEGNFIDPGVVDGAIRSYTYAWVAIVVGGGTSPGVAGPPPFNAEDRSETVFDRILRISE